MTLPLRQPPGVLGKIVARTLEDLTARQAATPRASLERRIEDAPAAMAPRGFASALRQLPGVSLIAEFKPRSPSRGPIRPDAVPEEVAAIYDRHAAAISVLCDRPFFGGGHELLARVRAACGLPVLCKDFLVTPYQLVEARAAGADAVLLMASLLPPESLGALLTQATALGMDALVEAHTEGEVAEALALGAPVIGVNSRDLHTLKIDTANARRLLEALPTSVTRVAESGLETASDVAALAGLADAALVGSALMAAPDIAHQIASMGWPPCR